MDLGAGPLAGNIEVIGSLVTSRKNWSRELLLAVEEGDLKPADVPTTSLKKILLHKDDKLAALVKPIRFTEGGPRRLSPQESRSSEEECRVPPTQ